MRNARAQILRRLKRIEGQTRGVQKMIQEDRDCMDILYQLNAINEAVRSVSRLLVEQYARECLQQMDKRKSRLAITEMLDMLARTPR